MPQVYPVFFRHYLIILPRYPTITPEGAGFHFTDTVTKSQNGSVTCTFTPVSGRIRFLTQVRLPFRSLLFLPQSPRNAGGKETRQ